MKHNGPAITKFNVEWFERICPPEITERAARKCVCVFVPIRDRHTKKIVRFYWVTYADNSRSAIYRMAKPSPDDQADLKKQLLERRQKMFEEGKLR